MSSQQRTAASAASAATAATAAAAAEARELQEAKVVVDLELQSMTGQGQLRLQSRHAHEEVARDLYLEIAELRSELNEK